MDSLQFFWRTIEAACDFGLLKGVGNLCGDHLESLFVLFGPFVGVDRDLGDKVASTRHTVILSKTWLIFINLLVKKLVSLIRLAILKNDLVDGSSLSFLASSLAVLLVSGRVGSASLGSAHFF
jgi:hypothetical protein